MTLRTIGFLLTKLYVTFAAILSQASSAQQNSTRRIHPEVIDRPEFKHAFGIEFTISPPTR
jgi:hypothetical protein